MLILCHIQKIAKKINAYSIALISQSYQNFLNLGDKYWNLSTLHLRRTRSSKIKPHPNQTTSPASLHVKALSWLS